MEAGGLECRRRGMGGACNQRGSQEHSLLNYGKDWLNSEGEGTCSEDFDWRILGFDSAFRGRLLLCDVCREKEWTWEAG